LLQAGLAVLTYFSEDDIHRTLTYVSKTITLHFIFYYITFYFYFVTSENQRPACKIRFHSYQTKSCCHDV